MYERILAVVGAISLSLFIGVPWYLGMKVVLNLWDMFLESVSVESLEDEDEDEDEDDKDG